MRNLHQRRQARQLPLYSVPSHHVPQMRPTRTHPAPLAQLEPIGRQQQQYRDERKVPSSHGPLLIRSLHGNRPPPPLRGTAPPTNSDGAGDRRTALLRTRAGAGKHTPPLLPPPVSNPGTTPHLAEAAELAAVEPGGPEGVRVGAGAAAAAARYAQSAPTQASPPTTSLQRALSPRATNATNPDTSSATGPTRTNRKTTAAVPR